MTNPQGQISEVLTGRYTVERQLGRGGMATVYLARDLKHDRPVALKVLHPELSTSLGPERFQREIRLAARLQHPHILTVLDSGEAAGQLWFTMPYVEGESLRERLSREKQLPVEDAIRIVREAAAGLEYAHQHGVVHRDIKPENILLTTDGSTLVADFGIARAIGGDAGRLTETGLAIGTPAYMSPEQASGERDLDARTDIYALGCVLYELLAGEPPFTGPTAQAIVIRAMTESARPIHPTRAAVAPAVDAIIAKATSRTPADRFASAAELARSLEAAERTNHRTSGPRESGPVPVSPTTTPARKRIPLLPVLGVGFLLGLGVLFAWSRNHESGERAGASGTKAIAVLPFENQGDSSDEYFADGMTDEVRGKLATLPELRVIAGSSAGQYKRSDKSPQQIAQELGVQYLLVGKVRWEKSATGNRVRVSPELIEISGGQAPTTRWQQPFDASLTDVFQVQADIAGRVAQALNVALAGSTQNQLAQRPTQNLAAYDAYLRGVEARKGGATPASLRQAVSQLEQAVALDTSFAPAWAALSDALSLYSAVTVASPGMIDRARVAAERAIALAPDRPDGYAALGHYYRRSRKDLTRAVAEYQKALQLAPADNQALFGMAIAEQVIGNNSLAITHLQDLQRLDPRSANVALTLGQALHYAKRYDEALSALDVSLALAPTSLNAIEWKFMVYLSQGDLPRAQAYLASVAAKLEPTEVVAYFATFYDLYWCLDADQQALLRRLTPAQFDNDVGSWGLALAGSYSLQGDRKRMLAYADSARQGFETQLHDTPNDAQIHALLGLALASLGRKADAIREAQRSLELMPPTANVVTGSYDQHQVVRIYMLVGEPEKALDNLEILLKAPYYLTPAWLKIDPNFDPLRKNPRFQKLIAGN